MKRKLILLGLAAILLLALAGCSAVNVPEAKLSDKPSVKTPGTVEISFDFARQNGIANNQFAVWVEDAKGNFVKSLFVTGFTGKGGYKQRPEALPEWVKRSGIASKEQADLVTGATPGSGAFKVTWDCTDESGAAVAAGDYSFFVEGTIAWKDDLYKGTITVGDKQASASALPVSKTSDDNDMLGDLQAVFTPAGTK